MIKGSIILKKNKEDFIKSFHSWIFSGAIEKIDSSEELKNGDIVRVYNYNKELLGYAFYEKPEQIVARIFYFGNKEIHNINQYFLNYFEQLFKRKSSLFFDSNAFRFIHSESDRIPGIICDIYNQCAIIQIDYLKSELLLNLLIKFLNTKNINYILLKTQKEIQWLTSNRLKEIEFKENHLNFLIHIDKFQKTGYFLDQKINRKKIIEYSKNKIVLDAFCYIGGFGIHALKGEAKKVVFVDSQNLETQIKNNIIINKFLESSFEIKNIDVFQFFNNMNPNIYDVMIIDPPAFVKTKAKINEGIKGYIKLNRLAIKNIKQEGHIFTFSCSQFIDKELFRKIIFIAAKEEKRNVYIKEYLTQAPDHTISVFHPEGEYLKGFILYVE
ncbi:MAG: SAM-dependent methyltransferase [Leptospiraceae bacterium]|nr:MAG: SAM-dependent methyltransferase [Leptospiraceae bacterium]